MMMIVDGAVMFFDHESEGDVSSSWFLDNYALNGGVAALRSSFLLTKNNTFRGNSAHIGGVLSVSTESSATCQHDLFDTNWVTDSGGAILLESTSYLNITR
jgi:hypothetical protein